MSLRQFEITDKNFKFNQSFNQEFKLCDVGRVITIPEECISQIEKMINQRKL